MATLEQSVGFGVPGSGVYPSIIGPNTTNSTDKLQECMVFPPPAGADIGVYITFVISQQYASTPVLVLRGVLNKVPNGTLAFGARQLALIDNGSLISSYEAEDIASVSDFSSYADEDLYEETITLTPTASAFDAGGTVLLWLYRDDSVDTDTTCSFLLTDVALRFSDA